MKNLTLFAITLLLLLSGCAQDNGVADVFVSPSPEGYRGEPPGLPDFSAAPPEPSPELLPEPSLGSKTDNDMIFITKIRIHESLPEFTFFRIVGAYSETYKGLPNPREVSIVIETDEGAPIQTITGLIQNNWYIEYAEYDLIFDDYNFDGYLDMRLMQWQEGSHHLNTTNYYWLWDTENSQFVLNEQLIKIGDKTDIRANQETQRVDTWLRSNFYYHEHFEYAFYDGEFVCTGYEIISLVDVLD